MSSCKKISRQVYRVGKEMDDGVQRVKVQGTTCGKNKHNEGVHNGRKYSGKVQEEKDS